MLMLETKIGPLYNSFKVYSALPHISHLAPVRVCSPSLPHEGTEPGRSAVTVEHSAEQKGLACR